MNIFARELVTLLGRYGKELGSLYGLHSLTYRLLPSKVTRLKRSLTENITATLNADDLDLLVKWLRLDPDGEEIRRLRAALLAEMIRYLLGGRMDVDVANDLGEVAFQLLIGNDPTLFLVQRKTLLGVMRGDLVFEENQRLEEEEDVLRGGFDDEPVSGRLRSPLQTVFADEQEALVVSWNLTDAESDQAGLASGPMKPDWEAAIETYEQGALWLEVARDTRDPDTRQGYLAQADALLRRAQHLAATGSASTQETEQEQEWVSAIETALNEVSALLSHESRQRR